MSSKEKVDLLVKEIEDFSKKEINTKDVESYIKDWSNLLFSFSEAFAWAYINYTCHTDNQEYNELIEYFYQCSEKVEPLFFEIKNNFYKKGNDLLDKEKYSLFSKIIKNDIELFVPENVSLEIEDAKLSKQYQSIMSDLLIKHDGNEYTLQQAAKFLEDQNRSLRKDIWEKISQSVYEKEGEINEIFSKMIELRHKMAVNAGFDNYRDFMHQAKNRFDYTPDDCYAFHEAVEKEVVPLYNEVLAERKALMKLDALKPFDLKVDPEGKKALHPFDDEQELVSKSLKALNRVSPQVSKVLKLMQENGFLDLGSRKGKAPGGYNYPLSKTGSSFIFMNAAGKQSDVQTLVHESGHALHAYLCNDIQNFIYKDPSMEVAELASMSMELLSMQYWDEFYTDKEDLKKAKLDYLSELLSVLPWIASIDAFQHQVYLNPNQSKEDRFRYWNTIMDRFDGDIDWSGYEQYRKTRWLRQNHVFTVPFYYIEYGIAQLGALQVWKNYLQDKENALNKYLNALSLGYQKPMTQIYEEAGIEFNFSASKIKEIMHFVKDQITLIKNA